MRTTSRVPAYALCEPVWATPTSRVHVRRLTGPPALGGTASIETLCGRTWPGWDLPTPVTLDGLRRSLNAETGPTCPECLTVWESTAG
jgi:hypothetical protein